LYQLGLLQLHQNVPNHDISENFWNVFSNALKVNPTGRDGKQRILSIIADHFTYEELKNELKVSNYNTYNIY